MQKAAEASGTPAPGYFIVYVAQLLWSAHGADFVAVLGLSGILDMIGAFAFVSSQSRGHRPCPPVRYRLY